MKSLRTHVSTNGFLHLLMLTCIFALTCGSSGCSSSANTKEGVVHEVFDENGLLKLDDSEQAIVIFFYSPTHEQTESQKQILKSVAAKFAGRVRFTQANYADHYSSSTNITHVLFYDVHHSPTFILRRRNESYYHKTVGFLDQAALEAFVTEGLSSQPRASGN